MVDLVVVGGGEVGAHGAVVVGDDDAAFAGGGGGVDVVFDVETWRALAWVHHRSLQGLWWKNVVVTSQRIRHTLFSALLP